MKRKEITKTPSFEDHRVVYSLLESFEVEEGTVVQGSLVTSNCNVLEEVFLDSAVITEVDIVLNSDYVESD